MVLMRTVDPEIFVRFKRWLANGAPDRDPQKRGRDLSQAEIVHILLEEGRLQSKIRQAFDNIPAKIARKMKKTYENP